MRTGASVSKAQLDCATLATQRELTHAGLWGAESRIRVAEVYWCPLPQVTMPGALGFFVHGLNKLHSVLGYEAGHTYIPQWVLTQGPWQNRGSLRDVIRHEYGHAIAHYYPRLIQRSPRFTSTFGGRYFGERRVNSASEDFVTTYAASCPAEDFAETLMFFLRHKGRLPERHSSSAIQHKWQFIADLAAIIDSGGIKW